MVLGGHGDTMVPMARLASVSGIPLSELLDQATIDRLVQRARDGGAEIVKYLRPGALTMRRRRPRLRWWNRS